MKKEPESKDDTVMLIVYKQETLNELLHYIESITGYVDKVVIPADSYYYACVLIRSQYDANYNKECITACKVFEDGTNAKIKYDLKKFALKYNVAFDYGALIHIHNTENIIDFVKGYFRLLNSIAWYVYLLGSSVLMLPKEGIVAMTRRQFIAEARRVIKSFKAQQEHGDK
jgi:hypothetical protein